MNFGGISRSHSVSASPNAVTTASAVKIRKPRMFGSRKANPHAASRRPSVQKERRGAIARSATALAALEERVDFGLGRLHGVLDALLAEVGEVHLAVEDRGRLRVRDRDVGLRQLDGLEEDLRLLPGVEVLLVGRVAELVEPGRGTAPALGVVLHSFLADRPAQEGPGLIL